MVLQVTDFSNSGGMKNVLIVMNARKPQKTLGGGEITNLM
jgi:hypothetical protein